jgi:Fur family ferric uptake transcriptional regulator
MKDIRKTLILPKQQAEEDLIISRDKYSEADFKKMIRQMNLKVTDQRLLIMSALVSHSKHITAQELFEAVHEKDKSIGFATVYRFLLALTENKLATKVRMGSLPARYEIAPNSHHDHLTCTSCGLICEFENASIEKLQVKVADHFGFVLEHHVLELYGICPQCQKKN